MIRYELVAYDPDKRNGDGEIPLISWSEVVQCHDCASYVPAWNGCTKFVDEGQNGYVCVEPSGFCAWGVRSKTEQEGL